MNYHQTKVEFVSGGQGCSLLDIIQIALTALLSYRIWSTVHTRNLAVDFLLLTMPLLLAVTLFADSLFKLNAAIALGSCAISFTHQRVPVNRRKATTPSKTNIPSPDPDTNPAPEIDFRQGFVTIYRAQMMLLTVLSILAVDFPVFPRKFGKTEVTGISLMDLGVGSFVFSLGIVASLPVLRRTPPSPSFWSDAWNSGRKTAPLVFLGIIRTILVKGIEYPEHVTEYGIHWNFFFTLAVIPVFDATARRLVTVTKLGFTSLAILLAVFHQLSLGYGGLEAYVLSDAPRQGIFQSNREGLTSLAGYGVIYLIGLDTGIYTLPPHPDYLKKGRLASRPDKRAIVLSSWSIIWWLGFLLLGKACRRTANAAYCAWILAMNVSLLLGYQLLSGGGWWSGSNCSKRVMVPEIYAAVNANSLAVFLIGNLLTGLINLSVETVFVTNKWLALFILECYLGVVTSFAWMVRRHKLKI